MDLNVGVIALSMLRQNLIVLHVMELELLVGMMAHSIT